jgi:hypothetical protein
MSHDISKSSPPLLPISLSSAPNEVLSLGISINGRRQAVKLVPRGEIYPDIEQEKRKWQSLAENAPGEEAEKQHLRQEPKANFAFINGEYYLIESSDPRNHVDGINYLELTPQPVNRLSTPTPAADATTSSATGPRQWHPPQSWNYQNTGNGSAPPRAPELRPPLGLSMSFTSPAKTEDYRKTEPYGGIKIQTGFRCSEPSCIGGKFMSEEELEPHLRDKHGLGLGLVLAGKGGGGENETGGEEGKGLAPLEEDGEWMKVYGIGKNWDAEGEGGRVGHPKAW